MHIVIIGNGIAGITAARFVRKLSGCRVTVISAETDYFFSRTALMYVYMGHVRFRDTQPYEDSFWHKNGIGLLKDYAERIDYDAHTVHLRSGGEIVYDKLLIATGSKSNFYGWAGADLKGVQGLYSYQDLETMVEHTKGCRAAVVVGGGLIGVEMAEMLHSRGIKVHFLVREANFWNHVLPREESLMIDRHILSHGIDLRLDTELSHFEGDSDGRVVAAVTKNGERLAVQFAGVTVGVSPNIAFLKDTPLETARGILVDEHLRTNIEDVYAAGDCVELRHPAEGRRAIEAVWYTGRMMGETAAYNMVGKPVRYDAGTWFNSAKFFDIEYQVYGFVPNVLPDDLDSWYHEDTRAASGERCLRIVFRRDTRTVVGFNALGLRLREETCTAWINDGASIDTVLRDFHRANFDPEFFKSLKVMV